MVETVSGASSIVGVKKESEKSGLSRMMDKKVDEQFDIFLKLFCTQMKNQDPTAPMDHNQMMNNLLMFFSAGEQAKTNELLRKINESDQSSAATSLLNKEVEYEGEIFDFDGQKHRTIYELPGDVEDARMVIVDDKNRVIKNFDLKTNPGKYHQDWDGANDSGSKVPNGIYQTKLIVKNKDDEFVKVKPRQVGIINSIEMNQKGLPYYYIGAVPIETSEIIRVRKSTPPTTQPPSSLVNMNVPPAPVQQQVVNQTA